MLSIATSQHEFADVDSILAHRDAKIESNNAGI